MSFVMLLKLWVIAASAPYNGFVLSKLWLWFVVPLGVPSIGIAAAMGIIVTITMARWSTFRFCLDLDAHNGTSHIDVATWVVWLAPTAALAAGWLCQYAGTF